MTVQPATSWPLMPHMTGSTSQRWLPVSQQPYRNRTIQRAPRLPRQFSASCASHLPPRPHGPPPRLRICIGHASPPPCCHPYGGQKRRIISSNPAGTRPAFGKCSARSSLPLLSSSASPQGDEAGNPFVGGEPKRVASVIVEPAQHLDVDGGDQPPVGEVGLPRLVRLLGLKAHIGRAGTFVGLRDRSPSSPTSAS